MLLMPRMLGDQGNNTFFSQAVVLAMMSRQINPFIEGEEEGKEISAEWLRFERK